jgi:hypothetical protein
VHGLWETWARRPSGSVPLAGRRAVCAGWRHSCASAPLRSVNNPQIPAADVPRPRTPRDVRDAQTRRFGTWRRRELAKGRFDRSAVCVRDMGAQGRSGHRQGVRNRPDESLPAVGTRLDESARDHPRKGGFAGPTVTRTIPRRLMDGDDNVRSRGRRSWR